MTRIFIKQDDNEDGRKKMRGRENVLLAFFAALLLFSIFMIIAPYLGVFKPTLTGFASSGSTTSNVTISKSISLTLSTNLSNGINFGNLTVSSGSNFNGSSNYDGASATNTTTYFVNISSTSTINVDLCIKGNGNLTSSGGDKILLANETYSNATTTSGTVPLIGNEVSLTTTGVKSGGNLAPGDLGYYRFWLDLNPNIPTGSYNNTVTFTGMETGAACT